MVFFVVEDEGCSVLLLGGAEGWGVVVYGDVLQGISYVVSEGIAA